MATNALTVVLLQFPLLHLLARWPGKVRLQVGITLFLGLRCCLRWGSAAVVALDRRRADAERGETILFPLLNVLIDQMSPRI